MRLIAVSDLHLGQSFNLKAFQSFCHKIRKKRPDYLLLLEDILDLAWFRWEGIKSQPFAKDAIYTLKDLAYHIPTIYICGNHDLWEKVQYINLLPISVSPDGEIELDDVLYTHGHQFDATTHLWDAILKTPLKKLAPWLYLKFYGTPYEVKSAQKEKDYREYVGWVMGRAMMYSIAQGKNLCFGHTHAPMTLDLGGRLIVNSGDLQDSWSYVLACDGRLQLKFWRPI